jgi:hypothetical protein
MFISLILSLFIGTGTLPEEPRAPKVYFEEVSNYIKPKNTSFKGRKQLNRLQSRKVLDK